MVREEPAISTARWMSEQLGEGGSRDGNFCLTRGYPARPGPIKNRAGFEFFF